MCSRFVHGIAWWGWEAQAVNHVAPTLDLKSRLRQLCLLAAHGLGLQLPNQCRTSGRSCSEKTRRRNTSRRTSERYQVTATQILFTRQSRSMWSAMPYFSATSRALRLSMHGERFSRLFKPTGVRLPHVHLLCRPFRETWFGVVLCRWLHLLGFCVRLARFSTGSQGKCHRMETKFRLSSRATVPSCMFPCLKQQFTVVHASVQLHHTAHGRCTNQAWYHPHERYLCWYWHVERVQDACWRRRGCHVCRQSLVSNSCAVARMSGRSCGTKRLPRQKTMSWHWPCLSCSSRPVFARLLERWT